MARLIVREHGKTYGEAVGEVLKGLETLEYAASMPQLAQVTFQLISYIIISIYKFQNEEM